MNNLENNLKDENEETILKCFLNKFSLVIPDAKNIFNIEEIILLNEKDSELYIQMYQNESESESLTRTTYSVNINKRYLIIFDHFKFSLKEFSKLLLAFRENLNEIFSNKETIKKFYSEILEISQFSNLLLFFSPEFYTIYNMKKHIFSEISILLTEEYLSENYISEFLFVNIINELNRKCSISWDYRLFLITKLNNSKIQILILRDEEKSKKLSYLLKQLKTLISLLNINVDEINNILIFDLALIHTIDEKEKRNYHLWKYIILVNKAINDKNYQKILFAFCLHKFINDPIDYSAYSTLKSLGPKIKSQLNKLQIEDLINYLQEVMSLFHIDLNKEYYLNFIRMLE